jgi:cytoskeleton protein RodZ
MSGGRETDNSEPGQSDNGGAIGARLKAAREARQLTAGAVAQQLKLDVSVIDALENDDRQHLPAPIFVQGYLRSYARLLELPEDELANAYTRQSGELPPLTVNRKSAGKPSLRLPSATLIRNVVLVMLALVLLWLAYPYASRMLDLQDRPDDEPSPGHLEIPPAER